MPPTRSSLRSDSTFGRGLQRHRYCHSERLVQVLMRCTEHCRLLNVEWGRRIASGRWGQTDGARLDVRATARAERLRGVDGAGSGQARRTWTAQTASKVGGSQQGLQQRRDQGLFAAVRHRDRHPSSSESSAATRAVPQAAIPTTESGRALDQQPEASSPRCDPLREAVR